MSLNPFTMPIPISALYLAIFAVFASVLSFFPGKIRGSEGISIGDGGRPDLLLAIRRQGNFLEYVPYFMLMFVALELNGATATWLHGLGITMFLSRIAHAVGLKTDLGKSPLRGVGAGGTFLVSLLAAGLLAKQYFQS